MDFLRVLYKLHDRGEYNITVYPQFVACDSKDLMVRGKNFYAIYDPETKLWTTNYYKAIELMDSEMAKVADKLHEAMPEKSMYVKYLKYSDSGSLDKFNKFVQKQMTDNWHQLDDKLLFQNMEVKKSDYASKRLPYSLEEGETKAWDKLVSTLYAPEERHKIEWSIGAVVSGDSKKLQKFVVFYGTAGSGKSTILNIIDKLFEGYTAAVNITNIGDSSNQFALEAFKSNPLVAIQHDGDLSRINDNSRLNSLVSHEVMMVNVKYQAEFPMKFHSFMFLGTNKPVLITDAKSGLLRRLIDIHPTGNTFEFSEYESLMDQIKFELGAIASKCLKVYKKNPKYYNNYVPDLMMDETNDFYNFVEDHMLIYQKDDCVTLANAWNDYKSYMDDANLKYTYTKRQFKTELKNYFKEFKERGYLADGTRVRNLYSGFRKDKFEKHKPDENKIPAAVVTPWLIFDKTESRLDTELADCPAQYAVEDENTKTIRPERKWSNCKTKLADIDTKKLHYVKPPENLITIDYDIKGEDGKKSFEKNLHEALKMPPTYAELSKSEVGIHLEYYYTGDVKKLSSVMSENVEIKVFPADKNGALRRKVTKCNDLPIATINSGLPLKGEAEKVINKGAIKTEAGLRRMIIRNLNKEIHANTTQSVSFIKQILDEAYESGMQYDVRDMYQAVLSFAGNSTHQAARCMDLVSEMHFASDDITQVPDGVYESNDLVFFDIEVFPNLLLVCYLQVTQDEIKDLVKLADISSKEHKGFKPVSEKIAGMKDRCVRLVNPDPADIEVLSRGKLVGFNCRRYDNHILYGRMNGYSIRQCYELSQKIINSKVGNAFFGNAYDLSYTDVYDFSSKKQSLKKFEIELGMYHLENEYPWDEDLDKSHWDEVGDYCCNDVISTLGTFIARHGDFLAREILSALSGLNVNATTNMHTTRIIFGKDKHPGLVYTDFRTGKSYGPGEEFKMPVIDEDEYEKVKDNWKDADFMNLPKNCFPGYYLVRGKDHKLHNMYRGVDLGFGGYVFASPGMYLDGAVTEDVASEHPHSAIELNLFGKYTKNFEDLVNARIFIKHGDYESAGKLFGGKLKPYLANKDDAKRLSKALKIAINSVYGLTSASFENAFRDPRNVNNIVALRGALFMKTVQDAVEEKGFHVIHIKTDSIKIEKPTADILQFVVNLGKQYGYEFEVEHTWDRLCLVNNAVFIGRHGKDDPDGPGEWDAVGTQFQIPYVFKSLFSHEPIEFEDMCETKSVNTSLYLDCNEGMTQYPEAEQVQKLRRSHKKYTKYEERLLDSYKDMTDEELNEKVLKGHNYSFVGKVGLFCPMEAGVGAGSLVRRSTAANGELIFGAVTGSKWKEVNSEGKTVEVNRWMESAVVKKTHKEKYIDRNYYRAMVDDARDAIEEFGSFDEFVS